jgi:NAD(P)-dependent dehydrogenase (short-subunit alcohol dehydrogenase family)
MLSAAADRIPHGAIIMSDPTSTHKVAAVTDGMGGIGQGIVVALPQRDFDVVVCDRNAGISAKSRGDLLDVSAESYDLNFTVNTRGAFFLTQAVCKKMLAAEGEFPESARSVYSYPPRTPSSQPGARGVRYD